MEAQFWLNKWQNNEIGFHLPAPHPWLVALWETMVAQKAASQTVFVPLCGKTLDLDFLLEQGCKVVANELSEDAVKAVFARLNLTPIVTPWAGGSCYQAGELTIYAGDFFLLNAQRIHSIDWVYDRAAIIALPADMRADYTQKLIELCPDANQCVITLDYDQSIMNGPPFAVSTDELHQHYGTHYEMTLLKEGDIIKHEPKFAQNGLPALFQRVYQLTPKLQA